jgi:STAS domain
MERAIESDIVLDFTSGQDGLTSAHTRLDRLLAQQAGPTITCELRAVDPPDVALVGALLRLQLRAGRCGRSVEFRGTTPALSELVALLGVSEVLRRDEGAA